MGENTTGGRGYKAERVPRRSSAKACRGKIVSPPAGHPSPSGPPLHPHGTRQNNKNESTKKLKRMNHFLKNNMQTCEFILQNFFQFYSQLEVLHHATFWDTKDYQIMI